MERHISDTRTLRWEI